jgi:hypothetical protein
MKSFGTSELARVLCYWRVYFLRTKEMNNEKIVTDALLVSTSDRRGCHVK